MQIIRFLEHEGELYKVGERVGVTYYNDYYEEGTIVYFGSVLNCETGLPENCLELERGMIKLSNIKSIKRLG